MWKTQSESDVLRADYVEWENQIAQLQYQLFWRVQFSKGESGKLIVKLEANSGKIISIGCSLFPTQICQFWDTETTSRTSG